jgi:hypothetical protein
VLPSIEFYLKSYLPRFSAVDPLITVVVTFAVCFLLHFVAERMGDWLSRHRVEATEERSISRLAPAPVGD